MRNHRPALTALLLASAACSALGNQAWAQSSDTEDAAVGLDEIVVTAQRRAESLQSVPIAITAVTGDQLQDEGVVNIDDLALQSPGVNIKSDFGATNPNIFIRGVGINDFNANVTGAVGVYIDEVYTASPAAQLFQFFDAERVEVLRGPQGTLYGRNTTGGAINFIARKPTDTVEADLYAEYGNYNAVTIDAGVGGPIAEGVSARLSGTFARRDGLVDNLFEGGEAPDELNDYERWGVRGQLAFEPTDSVRLLASGYMGASDATALQSQQRGLLDPLTFAPLQPLPRDIGIGVDAVGYSDVDSDNFAGSYNDPSEETVDLYGATLKAEFDIGDYSLTSVTAFQDVERFTIFDGDQGPISFNTPRHAPESQQFSQEVRLASPTDKRFSYLVGAFYFEEDLAFEGSFDLFRDARPAIEAAAADLPADVLATIPGGFFGGFNPIGSPDLAAALGNPVFALPAQVVTYGYDQDVETWALFGQAYLDLSDTVTATLGLRYSEEDRTFDYLSATNNDFGGPISVPLVVTNDALGNNTTDFDDLSYRIALDWQALPNLFVYGSVSQASKSGGFNGAALTAQAQAAPFDDETLTSWEGGARWDGLDNRLRVNATVFSYAYDDFQTFRIVNAGGLPQQVLTNAAEASVEGLELEVSANPLEGLRVSAALALLDGKFDEFDVDPNVGFLQQDFAGNDLPFSPDVAANADIAYTFVVGKGNVTLAGDIAYQDAVFTDISNAPRLKTDSYTLVGLRASYGPQDAIWEVGVWGRNVFDEEYNNYSADISDFGQDYVQFGEPATYGVSLRLDY